MIAEPVMHIATTAVISIVGNFIFDIYYNCKKHDENKSCEPSGSPKYKKISYQVSCSLLINYILGTTLEERIFTTMIIVSIPLRETPLKKNPKQKILLSLAFHAIVMML